MASDQRRDSQQIEKHKGDLRTLTDHEAAHGWYRQQIVKLLVPATLNLGGYLTLDHDVYCVDDFDATTFIDNGRALSRWEPKRQHAWLLSALHPPSRHRRF
jgi:hypothetical protein